MRLSRNEPRCNAFHEYRYVPWGGKHGCERGKVALSSDGKQVILDAEFAFALPWVRSPQGRGTKASLFAEREGTVAQVELESLYQVYLYK